MLRQSCLIALVDDMTNVSLCFCDHLFVLLQLLQMFCFGITIDCSKFEEGLAWKLEIMVDKLIFRIGIFGWNFEISYWEVCVVDSGGWTERKIIKEDKSLHFGEIIHHYEATVKEFYTEENAVLSHHDNFPDVLVVNQYFFNLGKHHKLIQLVARDFL